MLELCPYNCCPETYQQKSEATYFFARNAMCVLWICSQKLNQLAKSWEKSKQKAKKQKLSYSIYSFHIFAGHKPRNNRDILVQIVVEWAIGGSIYRHIFGALCSHFTSEFVVRCLEARDLEADMLRKCGNAKCCLYNPCECDSHDTIHGNKTTTYSFSSSTAKNNKLIKHLWISPSHLDRVTNTQYFQPIRLRLRNRYNTI